MNVILVVVDWFSKAVHFQTLLHIFQLANSLNPSLTWFCNLHGYPWSLISNRGPIFISKSGKHCSTSTEQNSEWARPITHRPTTRRKFWIVSYNNTYALLSQLKLGKIPTLGLMELQYLPEQGYGPLSLPSGLSETSSKYSFLKGLLISRQLTQH